MSRIARLAIRLYGLMLRGYPRRFRAEFAPEMQAMLADVLADAAARGGGDVSGGMLARITRLAVDAPARALAGSEERKRGRHERLDWIFWKSNWTGRGAT